MFSIHRYLNSVPLVVIIVSKLNFKTAHQAECVSLERSDTSCRDRGYKNLLARQRHECVLIGWDA